MRSKRSLTKETTDNTDNTENEAVNTTLAKALAYARALVHGGQAC